MPSKTLPTTQSGGHPRRWAILGVLVVSLLVVVLDNTVLNVAMKTIAEAKPHGLGATQSELEWSINSYTLVFAGLLFSFGVIGDRWGRRRILLIGMVLFGLASLACAYAQTPEQLIAARAFMGIGGAAVMPATLSVISVVFEPRERGKAIGIWAGSVGLAVAIGPIVGGLLIEHFWWGSVFLINVPVVLLGILGIAWLIPESRDPNPGKLDIIGVLLSVVGLVGVVYGIIKGGETGEWGRPEVWATLGGGVLVLAAFIWYENRTDHPSLDVKLFKNPRFSAAVATVGLTFFAAMGTFFFMSFYLQLVRDKSPLAAGALMVPFAAAQLIFAPLSASFVKKFGPKLVCFVGMAITTAVFIPFATIETTTPMWQIEVLFFLQGTGMAIVMPAVTESVMSALPREKAGVGSAVNNTIRQVAGALGIAVIGSVVTSVYRDRVTPAANALPASVPHEVKEKVGESIAAAHGIANAPGGLKAKAAELTGKAGELSTKAAELKQQAAATPGPAGQQLATQAQGMQHNADTMNASANDLMAKANDMLTQANDSFVSSMHWAAIISAAFAGVTALVVLIWLPRHAASMPGQGPSAPPAGGKHEADGVAADHGPGRHEAAADAPADTETLATTGGHRPG